MKPFSILQRSFRARYSSAQKYLKVSPVQHVLLRPDSYVGSSSLTDDQVVFLYDTVNQNMKKSSVRYVPALLKIFDEILVNAADNRQRDENMKRLTVSVDRKTNTISVFNDGEGIPIELHPEGVYVPTLIFGTLLTSSNYDDNESKIVGGRNGFGAKLCNIFSSEFVVETSSTRLRKRFKQIWKDNMSVEQPPVITDDLAAEDFTRITFKPDLSKFNLSELDETIFELMRRRTIDVAGTLNDVEVVFNGQKIRVSGFQDYVSLYETVLSDELKGTTAVPVYCFVNPRWKIAVAASNCGFQHVSFVNNIATTKGGTHVDYILHQISNAIKAELINRNCDFKNVRHSVIKNRLFLFVNSFVENPSFESQAKEYLTTPSKKFGSKCVLPQSFVSKVLEETDIVDLILGDLGKRKSKVTQHPESLLRSAYPKLEDAEYAGSANSLSCTLIITEGDSAKALAVAGLAVLGRSNYGVFPIRGKLVNVRGLTAENAMENAEIAALVRILGLDFNKDYTIRENFRTLRYGHVMIMTDQDDDGSHIKGLIMNFLHFFWPSLLTSGFAQCFVTPLIKARRGSEILSFYSVKDYENWTATCPQSKKYFIKYYKGLGTSTAKEAQEYFSNLDRHKVQFIYNGTEDDESVDLFFNRARADDRKKWITKSFEDSKKIEEPASNVKDISTFINKELILFPHLDLKRSIPCIVDGLKPSQRKILFTMFQRFSRGELRVSQLAGAVAQCSFYHHGEESLVETIIRMAQNFVGSNNINLLLPLGQFGTRSLGGADAASARYIYTSLNPVARLLFPQADDDILQRCEEENVLVEPVWYCPIVPLILINGADGIGTGWATKVLPHSPHQVIENIRRTIDGLPFKKMLPFFRNFNGTINELGKNRYEICGLARILPLGRKNSTYLEVEIYELPVRIWTQKYKERVLDSLVEAGLLLSYTEKHTEESVCFVLKFPRKEKLGLRRPEILKRKLKLSEKTSCNSMVLFDQNSVLRSYSRVEEIFEMYFMTRKNLYERRKGHLVSLLHAKYEFVENQLKFVQSIISNTLSLEKKLKSEIIGELIHLGFKSDPTKKGYEDDIEPDFGYLLDIPLIRLCDEEVRALSQKCESLQEQLQEVIRSSWKDLWLKDLDALEAVFGKKAG